MTTTATTVHELLRRQLPARKADESAAVIECWGTFETTELRGKRVPAHIFTDLGAKPIQLTRIERELNRNGATLVR